VVALLLVFLDWYISPTKPGEKKDLVLAMAQILAGTALLSGLYFTWRTLQVNREGQITERFTRAIEQLGATHDDNTKNLELRLGGIYALERIARESEEDHWSIMEVLTAYVRQHAHFRPEEAKQAEEDPPVVKESGGWEETEKTREIPELSADIQAIMTVIRRRTRSFEHGEPDRLDLGETNLSGAYLFGANLSGAGLSRAHLSGARLMGADLVEADLSGAYLEGADLTRVNLYEADLVEALLVEANLEGANLSRANLMGAEHLTQEQLEETYDGDENTQLPPDLKPPAHWNVKLDEQNEGD